MKQNDFWTKARKVLINKYAITLYVFAVLFIFVGEQSLINQISRKREIRRTKQEIEQIKAETTEASNLLQSLDNKDSLERFAREQYKMHTDNEDVYLVE
ncbi:MAG: septum formation initiator family protein [Paludibacteraceae bacterium]|jgi:cell division protein FtsB|nr:septum formation initiator family protein [Paludibacteraceae bacterium]